MRNLLDISAKKTCQSFLALAKNFQGQMTLFFAIAMVLIFTLMAFLVNVGMFVKAKINLQNAVDAAAYSGAAVQARQLTDIAYLNWELRNVYKEFMFKYYVLGQLSNPNTQVGRVRSTVNMDFKIPSLNASDPQDEFNIPSICIQFNDPGNNSSNICAIYSVPGVPRFQPVGLPGLDETHNEFINRIVQQKAQDCASRSDLNFRTATNWAYAVKLDNDEGSNADIFGDSPQIATNRMGAWPAAVELAIRVRNMEKIVNTPPETVCLSGGNGCRAIDDLAQQNAEQFPVNERTVKAFYAAYRNLGSSGGGNFLNMSDVNDQNELKQTFKLTELAPTERSMDGTSALLIPAKGDRTKRYLDLRLYLINYAIFYNAFAALSGQEVGAPAHAKCAVTKIAIPVPAYPFGFDKNPAFHTYYAVKGEVQYRALLNPFREREGQGVTMVAYAAAAPFGGRIGPMLFSNLGNNITPRKDAQNRTYSYVTALQTGGGAFRIGAPMPVDPSFWVQGPGETIGGTPDGGASVKFAIPNILYDTIDNDSISSQAAAEIHTVSGPDAQRAGLYDGKQYLALRMNLERAKNGGGVNSEVVEQAILGARAPTRYEAMNYLIPNVADSASKLDTPAYIPNPNARAGTPADPLNYVIPGPLFGPGTHFPTIQDIKDVVNEYITNNSGAVTTYVASLRDIAAEILRDSQAQAGTGGQGLERKDLYNSAAKIIYEDNGGTPTCGSLAGAFQSYFTGSPDCGYLPLAENISQSLQARDAGSETFKSYFQTQYVHPPEDSIPRAERDFLLTAYMPGPRSGADVDGSVRHPFLPGEDRFNLARRNFYSAKFVSFQSLIANTPFSQSAQAQEGNTGYTRNNPEGIGDFSGLSNLLTQPEVRDLFL